MLKFMKDLENISSKISKGQNLHVNLDKYGKSMASLYHAFSLIKFSMNYYTISDIYDDIDDNKCCYNSLYTKIYNRFQLLTRNYLDGKADVSEIKEIRQEVIEIMNIVISFIDQFRIYEHVFNRMEYRFKDKSKYHFDSEYYNTYFTNDLIHYIFSEKDNVMINGKIAQLVGQLPMRLSKERFFSYMREAFSLYHGAQKGSIDDFAYSIRTTAMLPVDEQQLKNEEKYKDYFDEYKKIIDILDSADYTNMDAATYHRLSQELIVGIEKINDLSDNFVLLAQLINDLYTAVLMEDYCIGNTTQTTLAKEIIRAINKECCVFQTDTLSQDSACDSEILDRISNKFMAFEGVQERIFSIIEKNEYVLDEYWTIYESRLDEFGNRELFNRLKMVLKLQSGSDFVALDEDPSYYSIPEHSYADNVCEKLIDDMQKAFKNWSQPLRRAVMATVFSQLPVLFNNTEEIQSYINISLMQCRDEAEQAATMEILQSIMEG